PPAQIGAFPVAKLSNATGGGYMVVPHDVDLRALMKQVAEELRHEYLLGFTPAVADNHEHTVKVEVGRRDYQAIARAAQKAGRK
ncbi:MAG TPA: hypothetical protein VFB99_03785, partial [Vicinamibacterales bacterium]|nr:hypothetical protein [Vicinamibacterales bacterium]